MAHLLQSFDRLCPVRAMAWRDIRISCMGDVPRGFPYFRTCFPQACPFFAEARPAFLRLLRRHDRLDPVPHGIHFSRIRILYGAAGDDFPRIQQRQCQTCHAGVFFPHSAFCRLDLQYASVPRSDFRHKAAMQRVGDGP